MSASELRGDDAPALMVRVRAPPFLGAPASALPSMSVSELRGDDAPARAPACAHVSRRPCFDLFLHVSLPNSEGVFFYCGSLFYYANPTFM